MPKNLADIDLSLVAEELKKHEEEWVAVSATNAVVAFGKTYRETLGRVGKPEEVVLLKVPPLDAALAPTVQ